MQKKNNILDQNYSYKGNYNEKVISEMRKFKTLKDKLIKETSNAIIWDIDVKGTEAILLASGGVDGNIECQWNIHEDIGLNDFVKNIISEIFTMKKDNIFIKSFNIQNHGNPITCDVAMDYNSPILNDTVELTLSFDLGFAMYEILNEEK